MNDMEEKSVKEKETKKDKIDRIINESFESWLKKFGRNKRRLSYIG